jgi:hypothetical protein
MQVECPHCHQQFEASGNLPKEHKEAVGLAYYSALGATTTWDTVNNTGTLIALLLVSAKDVQEKKIIRTLNLQNQIWGEAMMNYSNTESESHQIHATYQCKQILINIEDLSYRFGKVPSGGFKLTASGGSG